MNKKISARISYTLGALAFVLALLVGLGAPAFAAGSPVNVNATVGQSVTLTGVTTPVVFPAATPGQTATVTGAEAYQVSTNDSAGYTVTVTAGLAAFSDGGSGGTIPDNSWVITETTGNSGTGAGVAFNPAVGGTVAGSTKSAGTDSYTENWALNIPAGQAAGNYNNTATYLAIGN